MTIHKVTLLEKHPHGILVRTDTGKIFIESDNLPHLTLGFLYDIEFEMYSTHFPMLDEYLTTVSLIFIQLSKDQL